MNPQTAGKGIDLPDQLQGLSKFSFGNQADIALSYPDESDRPPDRGEEGPSLSKRSSKSFRCKGRPEGFFLPLDIPV